MQTRTLGNPTVGQVEVSAIGLGEMPLSLADRPARDQALRPVRAALDAGVPLIDTARTLTSVLAPTEARAAEGLK